YIEGYIPNALLEAAKIDGASHYRIFWSVVMPVIKPSWLTLMLFSFRDVWSSVPNGTIFTEQLKTLPQIVSQITAGGTARAGSAMAVTVIMMIPPIIIYLISQSNVVEAMSSAGIKE
ncbi:MAG: ABC transporter permease subunit, partial [Acutalibacteraceae bacterium]|nr:ABC transporter permease subunit [Acutalibacteraceae bacterium]